MRRRCSSDGSSAVEPLSLPERSRQRRDRARELLELAPIEQPTLQIEAAGWHSFVAEATALELLMAITGVDRGAGDDFNATITFSGAPSPTSLSWDVMEDLDRRIADAMRVPAHYLPNLGLTGQDLGIEPGRVYYVDAQQFREDFVFRGSAPASSRAEERAEKLLREWLSPPQLAQYHRDKTFEVVGGATGQRYRIDGTLRSYHVRRLDARGREVEMLCFVPEGAPATGDILLAQKIALETDERAALAVANRQPIMHVGDMPRGNGN